MQLSKEQLHLSLQPFVSIEFSRCECLSTSVSGFKSHDCVPAVSDIVQSTLHELLLFCTSAPLWFPCSKWNLVTEWGHWKEISAHIAEVGPCLGP